MKGSSAKSVRSCPKGSESAIATVRMPSTTKVAHTTVSSESGQQASEVAAYEAPFPAEEYKAATRVYPQLVPQLDEHMSVEENKGAFKRVFTKFERPVLTLFSDSDPVSNGGEKVWQTLCPGAKLPGIPHQILPGGHFLQHDSGDEIVKIMIKFIEDFPVTLPAPAAARSRL